MAVIIVSGNPVSGFEYLGPFQDLEAAEEYARSAGGVCPA
jgi:hypothetical protein